MEAVLAVGRPSERLAPAALAALCGVKLLLHLGLAGRYDYHGDELYFIACGRRLAWGYVDHPPIVPWLTRLADEAFGASLWSLRGLSALAGALSVVLAVAIARRLGGGRFAQLLAGLAMLVAPVYLRMASILCIPAIELLWWTLASFLVVELLARRAPRLWLAVGLTAGLGLMTKHTMLFWCLGLFAGLVLTAERRQLATPWPWAGGAVALAVFLPNLVWQARHEWATAQFIRNISEGMLAEIPRSLFLLGQLVYMHPLLLPLWVAGLVWLFSGPGRHYRLFAWSFLVVLAALLLIRAKPYYLAPAYPVLLAAGAVWIEELARRRDLGRRGRRLIVGALVAGGAAFAAVALPILPLATADRIVERVFGFAIGDPALLTGEFHEQYGWREQTALIAEVFRSLPPEEQRTATILTRSYNQAAAVEHFGPSHGLPGAVSGHQTFHLWGPGSRGDRVVVAYALPRELLGDLFHEVSEVARFTHPLAPGYNNDLPVYVCRRPRLPLAAAWPRLRRYDNAMPPRPREAASRISPAPQLLTIEDGLEDPDA